MDTETAEATKPSQQFYLPVRSSWISSLLYWPQTPGAGFLLIIRKDGTGTLYAGISPVVASELAGIGKVDHSVGKAYHRLFRSAPADSVEGKSRVSQQLSAQQVAEALEMYKAATAQ